MKRVIKGILTGALSIAAILSANAAMAGPSVDVTVNNKWTSQATYISQTCIASVSPAFTNIPASTNGVVFETESSFSDSYSCSVKYEKGSTGKTCLFQFGRTKTLWTGSGWAWKAPVMYVTKSGSGINCAYSFYGDGADGSFNVILNLNN